MAPASAVTGAKAGDSLKLMAESLSDDTLKSVVSLGKN